MSLFVDIEKHYSDFNLKIKFETNENISSLLGESGSGKSLTLKAIAGIITPDKGKIVLNDRVLFDSENKINVKIQDRNVGYFFQDYALFPNMNVKQNILMGMKKYPKDFDRESKLIEIAKLMHIENLLSHLIHQLSGGQKQRVALARILVNNPEIILFDEPFSALDEHLRTKLEMDTKELLEKINKEAVIVTHNRDEAYTLSKQTILLNKGEVIESNKTKELFKNPKMLKTAIITGCKNYEKCEKNKDGLFVPNWGITFRVKDNIDEINFVGIRAHSFKLEKADNTFDIEVVDIIEQPFENLIRFRFANQDKNTDLIYFLTKKDNTDYFKIKKIGLNKEDILLLK